MFRHRSTINLKKIERHDLHVTLCRRLNFRSLLLGKFTPFQGYFTLNVRASAAEICFTTELIVVVTTGIL